MNSDLNLFAHLGQSGKGTRTHQAAVQRFPGTREVPELFGHAPRQRFLLSLFVHGPAHVSELGRRIGVEKHHAFDLARHFERLGIVSKRRVPGEFFVVDFDQQFVAYRELRSLLSAQAASLLLKPVETYGRRSSISSRHQPSLERLFGSRARTYALAIIERVGEISIVDLSRLANISHGSARVVVRHFVSEGILESQRTPPNIYLRLAEDCPCHDELVRLIRKVGSALPGVRELHRFQQQRVKERSVDALSKLTGSAVPAGPERFVPFGRPTQAALLLALSRTGAMRTTDLATLLSTTREKVRGVSTSLILAGIVVGQTRAGRRNTERWLSLNKGHPLYRKLFALLVEIKNDHQLRPRYAQVLGRGRPEKLPSRSISKITRIWGWDRANEVLCALFERPDQTLDDLCVRLTLKRTRIATHLGRFVRTEILCTKVRDGRLRFYPNAAHAYAKCTERLVLDALSRLRSG